jgi:thioredoxin-related protein
VVKTYHQFKDANFKSGKGFEIFSVSLDQSKDRWIKAIEQDKLGWDNHVSDLRGWSSQGAAIYGVNSIPRTFLIDGKGKIIGMNLRGQQIANALKALQE